MRNKKDQIYCYNERRKTGRGHRQACGKNAEITRFKGLGEISPHEFKGFIGEDLRLDPVLIDHSRSLAEMLQFYMGKNTPDRQKFIIENLRVELDLVEGDDAEAPVEEEVA